MMASFAQLLSLGVLLFGHSINLAEARSGGCPDPAKCLQTCRDLFGSRVTGAGCDQFNLCVCELTHVIPRASTTTSSPTTTFTIPSSSSAMAIYNYTTEPPTTISETPVNTTEPSTNCTTETSTNCTTKPSTGTDIPSSTTVHPTTTDGDESEKCPCPDLCKCVTACKAKFDNVEKKITVTAAACDNLNQCWCSTELKTSTQYENIVKQGAKLMLLKKKENTGNDTNTPGN